MAQRHYPGETIGIIGSSISAAVLAQAAGKLGYRVASLVTSESNPVRQFASWQTVTESYNEQVLRYFSERVDVVTVEMGILSNREFQLLASLTDLTLSEDLIAITTDRLIEKAYLDANRCLVAPFSLVTNLTDLKEAVEYIGFPCILKSTQRHVKDADEHIVLYSEEDYDLAVKKLDETTCILEAWIPTEKKASVTVIRNERGEVLIYPVFEVKETGDELGRQVRYPAQISKNVEKEMNRLAQYLADSLNLVGSLTLKVLITSAEVVYINEASIGLSDEAMFTIGSMSISHYEAAARAILGLPLPNLHLKSRAAISLSATNLNEENLLTQLMLRTDWGFALFNPLMNESERLIGQVIVTGDSLSECERQIQITELTK
ncbi:ATP-grasp domain-containing protein [Aerococcaceae bacterium WGS1372]